MSPMGVCELLQPVAPLEAARDAAAFPWRAARVDLLRVAVGAAVHFTAACTRGERAMLGVSNEMVKGGPGVWRYEGDFFRGPPCMLIEKPPLQDPCSWG